MERRMAVGRTWLAKVLVVVVLAGVVAGCISTRVKVWQADDFDLAGHLRYRWGGPPLAAEHGASAGMVVIDSTVREQVDQAMVAKGYREGEPADIEIDYRVGGEMVVSQPGPLSPRDIGEQLQAGSNTKYEISSALATHRVINMLDIRRIKLTVLDTRDAKMVWEAVASRPVDIADSTAEKVTELVRHAVKKLMRRFPEASPEKS